MKTKSQAVELNRRCINYMLLNTSFSNKISILDGKAASVLFFSLNKDHYPGEWIEDVIADLTDEILSQLNFQTSLTYGDGISGIGCLLSYLYNAGYISESATYYLEEAENYLLSSIYAGSIQSFGLKSGIVGVGTYFLSIYRERILMKDMKFLRLKEALIAILDQLTFFWHHKNFNLNYMFDIWNGWSTVLLFLKNLETLGLAKVHVEKLIIEIKNELLSNLYKVNDPCVKLGNVFNLIASFNELRTSDILFFLEEAINEIILTKRSIPTISLAWALYRLSCLSNEYRIEGFNKQLLILEKYFYSKLGKSSLDELFPFIHEYKNVNQGLEDGIAAIATINISLINKRFDWLGVLGYDIIKNEDLYHEKN